MRCNRAVKICVAVLSIAACGGEAGTDDGGLRNDVPSGFVNGQHRGDIWYLRGSRKSPETHIFNLETGQDTKFSNTYAFPSRDGKKYVNLRYEVDDIGVCRDQTTKYHTIEVKDTATNRVLSSFDTVDRIRSPIRLSPDGLRILAKSNEPECESGYSDSFNASVYSLEGELLFRAIPEVIGYDWLPDNRLALLQSIGGWEYVINYETAPGSMQFEKKVDFDLNPEVTGFPYRYMGDFRVGPDGNNILLNAVIDENSPSISVYYRYAHTLLLDMNAGTIKWVYKGNEVDGSLKTTMPVFSPDGEYILNTHDYISGSVFGSGDELLTTDIISIPTQGNSFIVPLTTVELPVPPNEQSSSVHVLQWYTPVGTTQPIGLSPLTYQMWTVNFTFIRGNPKTPSCISSCLAIRLRELSEVLKCI